MNFWVNLIKNIFVAFRDGFFYVLEDERGIAPLIGAALIGGGSSLLGGIASGIAGSNASNAALDQSKWATNLRKKAYDEMLARAGTTATEGESALSGLTGTQLPELAQMKEDVLNNNNQALNQGASQLQASLQQAGLRGGQAGTQLSRGIGSMTQTANQDINKMIYDEANQRKQLQAAYEAAKAQAGTQANLQQFA